MTPQPTSTTDSRVPRAGDAHAARHPASPWRRYYLLGLAVLSAYSTGVAWQAQLVSYPLYRAVAADDFLAYHAQYGVSIPGPVIVPGFATFLACMAFPWAQPHGIARRSAALVALSGLVAFLATVLWAIPCHVELARIGQSSATIDSLLRANAVRTAALMVGTTVLAWCLDQMIRHAGAPRAETRVTAELTLLSRREGAIQRHAGPGRQTQTRQIRDHLATNSPGSNQSFGQAFDV